MGFLDKLKKVMTQPPVNDVSTTPEDPPAFRACANLPDNADRSMRWSGRDDVWIEGPVTPLETTMDPDELFRLIVELASEQDDWTIIAADEERHRLEAVATTALMRFKDDIAIELRGSVVHMRSKSRVGKGDLGKNEQRIRRFLRELRGRVEA